MAISKGEMQFNADTHEYELNGEKYISVTQLLKKHGLSPDYSKIPTETLNAAAEKGKVIHNEIDRYIKSGEVGFTPELGYFIDLCDDYKLTPTSSEVIVYNTEYKVAGTIDLWGFCENNAIFIADHKTTSTLHTESLSWQLSLYRFLAGNEVSITKAFGTHLRPTGGKLVEVKFKPESEVMRLLEAEKNGETYAAPKQEVIIAQQAEIVRLTRTIDNLNEQKKEAEAALDEIKQVLIKAMKNNGIKSLENDYIALTYVAPTTRSTIDSARLKKELPDVAAAYSKTSEVAESLRIKVK